MESSKDVKPSGRMVNKVVSRSWESDVNPDNSFGLSLNFTTKYSSPGIEVLNKCVIASRDLSNLLFMLALASNTNPMERGASWLTTRATICSTPSSKMWKKSGDNPRTGFPKG